MKPIAAAWSAVVGPSANDLPLSVAAGTATTGEASPTDRASTASPSRHSDLTVPPRPGNEELRLHSLRSLEILDTPPEERFDRLTRLARSVCRTPIAVVSLVDENRQWFKSITGLEAKETPRDVSFCGHAILSQGVFVVENATEDPRFATNPFVVESPGIRAYAGAPLRLPNGSVLGTLCVIDTATRKFSADDLSALADLARLVENELLAVEMAALDELTMLPNRRGLNLLSQYVIGRAHRDAQPLSALLMDINDFKGINDRHGHASGDDALKWFGTALKRAFRQNDVVARLGGDEFVVLAQGQRAQLVGVLNRLQTGVDDLLRANRAPFALTYSVGLAEYDRARHAGLEAWLAEADQQMYAHKRARRGPG